MRKLVLLGLLFALAACGTVNNALSEKTKHVEYYRIFDIKTNASRTQIIQAASNGLGRNVNNADESTPIPDFSTPPDAPGRFKLVNPFAGSQIGQLAAMAGVKMVSCPGAVWIAKANRHVTGSNNLNLTACLFQYKDGYQLDMYGAFTKEEGGLMQISRAMANAMVGTPEQWTEKTFLDVVKQIYSDTHANITFVEGYPAISGTPWIAGSDSMAYKK